MTHVINIGLLNVPEILQLFDVHIAKLKVFQCLKKAQFSTQIKVINIMDIHCLSFVPDRNKI